MRADPDNSEPRFSSNLEEFSENVRRYYEKIYAESSCQADSIPDPLTLPTFNEDKQELKESIRDLLEIAVKKLKIDKAPGDDEITNLDLRLVYDIDPEFLVEPIDIFVDRLDIETSDKVCLINPIMKPRKSNKPASDYRYQKNWRPIALLNSIFKLLELTFRPTLVHKIDPKLSDTQFGFREKRSTLDPVLILREIVSRQRFINPLKPTPVFIAVLDFKGAFDSVPRSVVWSKLFTQFGVRHPVLYIIKNLFSGIKGKARLRFQDTKFFDLIEGVVQGSVLGPILFSIFINDLLEKLQKTRHGFKLAKKIISVLAYADDLILIAKTPKGLQSLLDIAGRWSRKNGMEFGLSKCLCATFNATGSKIVDRYSFYLYGVKLENIYLKTTAEKYLGIQLTNFFIAG